MKSILNLLISLFIAIYSIFQTSSASIKISIQQILFNQQFQHQQLNHTQKQIKFNSNTNQNTQSIIINQRLLQNTLQITASNNLYNLYFQYAPRTQGAKLSTSGLNVAWNNNIILSVQNLPDGRIRNFSQLLLAKNGTNILRFIGTGQSDGLGMTIDNIKLNRPRDNLNYIINGDFQYPSYLNGWGTSLDMPGWSSTQIQIGNGRLYNRLWENNQVCELDGNKNYIISQQIDLGDNGNGVILNLQRPLYNLSFYYSAKRKFGIYLNSFSAKIYWNGRLAAPILTPLDYNIGYFSVIVSAEAHDNNLTIVGSGSADNQGLQIDNVSLTPINSFNNLIVNGGFQFVYNLTQQRSKNIAGWFTEQAKIVNNVFPNSLQSKVLNLDSGINNKIYQIIDLGPKGLGYIPVINAKTLVLGISYRILQQYLLIDGMFSVIIENIKIRETIIATNYNNNSLNININLNSKQSIIELRGSQLFNKAIIINSITLRSMNSPNISYVLKNIENSSKLIRYQINTSNESNVNTQRMQLYKLSFIYKFKQAQTSASSNFIILWNHKPLNNSIRAINYFTNNITLQVYGQPNINNLSFQGIGSNGLTGVNISNLSIISVKSYKQYSMDGVYFVSVFKNASVNQYIIDLGSQAKGFPFLDQTTKPNWYNISFNYAFINGVNYKDCIVYVLWNKQRVAPALIPLNSNTYTFYITVFSNKSNINNLTLQIVGKSNISVIYIYNQLITLLYPNLNYIQPQPFFAYFKDNQKIIYGVDLGKNGFGYQLPSLQIKQQLYNISIQFQALPQQIVSFVKLMWNSKQIYPSIYIKEYKRRIISFIVLGLPNINNLTLYVQSSNKFNVNINIINIKIIPFLNSVTNNYPQQLSQFYLLQNSNTNKTWIVDMGQNGQAYPLLNNDKNQWYNLTFNYAFKQGQASLSSRINVFWNNIKICPTIFGKNTNTRFFYGIVLGQKESLLNIERSGEYNSIIIQNIKLTRISNNQKIQNDKGNLQQRFLI